MHDAQVHMAARGKNWESGLAVSFTHTHTSLFMAVGVRVRCLGRERGRLAQTCRHKHAGTWLAGFAPAQKNSSPQKSLGRFLLHVIWQWLVVKRDVLSTITREVEPGGAHCLCGPFCASPTACVSGANSILHSHNQNHAPPATAIAVCSGTQGHRPRRFAMPVHACVFT